jgi:spermidine synthase
LKARNEVIMSNLQPSEAAFVRHWSTLTAVFSMSLSLLLSELLLTRIFSVLFMYHFAFMVISLALFGLGVGGIAVYLFPGAFAGDLQRRLVTLALAFSAAVVLLVLFLFNFPLAISSGIRGTLTVALVYLAASLPFFVGGTCLSLLLARAGQEVNRLYFADLVGAGAGCLVIIPVLNQLGGATALLSASVGGAVAATMFALPARRMTAVSVDAGRLLRRTLLVIAMGFGLAALLLLIAEPLAAWVGQRLFHLLPKYVTRPQSFQRYFEAQVQPEIQRIAAAAWLPLLGGCGLALAALVKLWRVRMYARGRAILLRHELRLVGLVALVTTAGLVVLNEETAAVRVRFAKGRAEFQNLFEGWNSFSRIAVVARRGAKESAYAWGLSPLYKGPPGEQLALDIDSLAGTPLVKFDGDLKSPGLEHLRHDITALAYVLRGGRKTLIIGPGGGRDVLTALTFGSTNVDAVELNPIIVDAVNKYFGDFTGRLYQLPQVHLTIDDGRHFVRRSTDTFGLIQLALVDTWASTAAGAFALSENTLYTREAFTDYLNHLEPDGMLTVTRWLEYPPRETLRVVSLARAALQQVGVSDVRRNILVAGTPPLRRGHRFASVVVSRRPFTDTEIAAAREFIHRMGFTELYLPDAPRDPIFSQLITTTDVREFLQRYEFDVSPSTDDRPFFFNPVKPLDFLRPWQPRPGRMGVQLLARLMAVVTLLLALFIFVPLYARRRSALAAVDSLARWSTLLYFGALGAGFMLIEVALISKLVLFLGPPIYALTVALCSLLIAAGLGSYWSGRNIGAGHGALRWVLAAALVAIAALCVMLDAVFTRLLANSSFAASVALTVGTLGPVGFLMGMPFPLGLRLLDRVGPEWAQLVPWVWGINGAASVLGSILAISVAINLGFRVTMLVGLCMYAAALAASGHLAGGSLPQAALPEAATVRRAAGGRVALS